MYSTLERTTWCIDGTSLPSLWRRKAVAPSINVPVWQIAYLSDSQQYCCRCLRQHFKNLKKNRRAHRAVSWKIYAICSCKIKMLFSSQLDPDVTRHELPLDANWTTSFPCLENMCQCLLSCECRKAAITATSKEVDLGLLRADHKDTFRRSEGTRRIHPK